MEKKKSYYEMSNLERIKEFVGEGGCIAFEHGFRRPIVMVTDKEVYFRSYKRKLDELSAEGTKSVWEYICEYLAYCQHWA